MYCDQVGRPVLQGDGSFGFQATVDGDDLVVRNVRATWFGGDRDPHDDGHTASGVSTRANPDLDGCALPMGGFGLARTEGSPLPRLPWHTRVRVYSREARRTLELELVDVGPAKPPAAHAAIDLTGHAFAALGGQREDGDLLVDYRVLGGARYLTAETRAAIAALPPAGQAAGGACRVVWLTGDYVVHHDRQAQAAQAGCAVCVDFHFNSNGATASGGEVWHKPGDDAAYRLALAIKEVYRQVGLSPRDPAVRAATSDARAGFIRHYPCPAVLLEPLFLSNPTEAAWLHNTGHLIALGEALATALKAACPPGPVIGLSVGHVHKRVPGDEGAACVRGDTEADHARQLAQVVAAALTAEGAARRPA